MRNRCVQTSIPDVSFVLDDEEEEDSTDKRDLNMCLLKATTKIHIKILKTTLSHQERGVDLSNVLNIASTQCIKLRLTGPQLLET